ncbi:MAG TPA: dTDP-4-dehydrorhamnose reductase [Tepidiformaceae bacterium]|nr:dTDP-4-dehydrorhamnose reductase [Tepidiformaceae bacterium]
MKILLLGANGQLGSDIRRLWDDAAIELITAVRADADVTDAAAIGALIDDARPDVVINTTAFHNLPVAESDPETCFRVNVVGGWNVARAAAGVGAALVQISTDYVFDGERREAYVEHCARRALNVYGAAKIATEDVVRQVNAECLIVRVSGLYGLAGSAGKGGNFVETMLRLAGEGQPLRVVSDQVTAPTNTAEIAAGLLPVVRDGMRGVVHLAADGACSWHEFAGAIFELSGLSPELHAVTTDEFGGPVRRPLYSVLGSERVARLAHWREGLERYLAERRNRA